MTSGTVRLERQGQVADLVLDRPQRLHALTLAMLDEIDVHLDKLADDDTVAVVRVRSAGSSCFCAGADLDEFAAHTPSDIWRRWNRRGQEVFARLAGLPHPSIAVLHGHALGGGLELALHCDLRVAAITARLGLPETTVGTIPGWSGVPRLAELVGPGRARLMILTGRLLDAPVAYDWGVVEVVAEPADLDAAVDRLTAELLDRPVVAMRLARELLARSGSPERLAGALAAATGTTAGRLAAAQKAQKEADHAGLR